MVEFCLIIAKIQEYLQSISVKFKKQTYGMKCNNPCYETLLPIMHCF